MAATRLFACGGAESLVAEDSRHGIIWNSACDMKKLITILAAMVAGTLLAQETNALHGLKQAYVRQEQSILAEYGKTLETVLVNVKRQGDLDNFLAAQTEIKRLGTEKTVPFPADAQALFRPACAAYQQMMVRLLGQYVAALDDLIRKDVAADRIEEAKAVKSEKDNAAFRLAELQSKLPEPVAAETPVPAVAARKPRTYVDETRGLAGSWTNHNTYGFHVTNVSKVATFRFWGSGNAGIDTTGHVLLTGPRGQKQIICNWKPSDFKIAASSVHSYQELAPISCDISAHVRQPGEYQFTFTWEKGAFGLAILRVELELQ